MTTVNATPALAGIIALEAIRTERLAPLVLTMTRRVAVSRVHARTLSVATRLLVAIWKTLLEPARLLAEWDTTLLQSRVPVQFALRVTIATLKPLASLLRATQALTRARLEAGSAARTAQLERSIIVMGTRHAASVALDGTVKAITLTPTASDVPI